MCCSASSEVLTIHSDVIIPKISNTMTVASQVFPSVKLNFQPNTRTRIFGTEASHSDAPSPPTIQTFESLE